MNAIFKNYKIMEGNYPIYVGGDKPIRYLKRLNDYLMSDEIDGKIYCPLMTKGERYLIDRQIRYYLEIGKNKVIEKYLKAKFIKNHASR